MLDHDGLPKVAYHHLRRALRPVAVWTTDEGVAGVAIHVANDRCDPLRARLRLALYRDFESRIEEVVSELELAPHSTRRARRRGPDSAASSMRRGPTASAPRPRTRSSSRWRPREDPATLLSQAFRFPAGPPIEPRRPSGWGSRRRLAPTVPARLWSRSRAGALAYGVRIHAPGFAPDDDA